ncbi:MAG TPA: hypothetical protein VKD72_10265, partial [Gemmataceae bacterium]|nr:hypothetical protein [Gemmataceae bacterium]
MRLLFANRWRMVWRKWVVRGLVFFALGGATLAGFLYQVLTNPEAVRRKVLARLQADLVGVNASLDSARLRLFGGIAVQELRLSRRDDLDKSDFLYVPSAVLYHDKEHLLNGTLSIRKVEIHRPRLRLVRARDGRWNLSGLFKEGGTREQLPTVVVKQGTLVVEDRLAAAGTPPIEIKNVHLSMVNDPLPVMTFEGSGSCDVAGPVRLSGRWQRDGGAARLTIELPAIDVGPDLVQRLAGYCADAAVHARQLAGKGSLQAKLDWDPRSSRPFHYTVTGTLAEGSFGHAQLPWQLEQLRGNFRCENDISPQAEIELHANAGPVTLDAKVNGLPLDSRAGTPWIDAAQKLDLTARHIPVKPELFDRLPPELQVYQKEYRPAGTMTVRLSADGLSSGEKRKKWTLEAEDMQALYSQFRYPVEKIRGTIKVETITGLPPSGENGSPPDRVTVDLRGEAARKPVFLKGEVGGDHGPNEVRLDLWGNDLPVDETLLTALPEPSRHAAHNFSPTGLLDYKVFIRRPRGQDFANRFVLHLHDGTVCYKVFPLPLSDVSVTLDFLPDRWTFQDFVGHHGDGIVRASGSSQPLPPAAGTAAGLRQVPRERVSLTIKGVNVPLDEQFRAALAPGREALAAAWDTFRLDGHLSFDAHIDDLPNQPQDIDVTVAVAGCHMNPKFFPYALDDVSATVRYARSAAWLANFHGRHGSTVLRI